ncbi:MAG TPA: hypothetical protein VF796_11825 [Humisphaera sp.]
MEWFEKKYPTAVGKYAHTSSRDKRYNCIGWAATGQKNQWWQHTPGYKWPAKRSSLVESLVAVFVSLGYEQRDRTETALEPGYEKVAVYARNGFWKHAARQLPSGKWTSKLGLLEDIEHDDPTVICGLTYGEVHCIMRRAIK